MLQPRTQASIYAAVTLPLRTCCKIYKQRAKLILNSLLWSLEGDIKIFYYLDIQAEFSLTFQAKLILTDGLKPISTRRNYLYEAKR